VSKKHADHEVPKKPPDHGARYWLRLSPHTDFDTIPASVNRYLPGPEHLRLLIRQHPVVLAPTSASAAGVLLATVVATRTSRGDRPLILLLWIIWAFFLLRLAAIILNWSLQYIAITDEDFMMTGGLLNRTVTVISLDDAGGLTFRRSGLGSLTGYGAFRIGFDEAGPLSINYVPYPDQIYLALREAIQAAKAAGGSAPDGDAPGDEERLNEGGGGVLSGRVVEQAASEPGEGPCQPGVLPDQAPSGGVAQGQPEPGANDLQH
jgi:hypothetical protein